MAFATRLRDLRRARGLTLAVLAERSGVHPTQLGRLERGLRPSIDAIGRLARALNVPPAELANAAFADLEPEPEPVEAAR